MVYVCGVCVCGGVVYVCVYVCGLAYVCVVYVYVVCVGGGVVCGCVYVGW